MLCFLSLPNQIFAKLQIPMAEEKNKNSFNKYLQLTSIGFQMMAIMFAFIWLGRKADEKWNTSETNYFTLLGTLLGLGISLYFILKQLKNINK